MISNSYIIGLEAEKKAISYLKRCGYYLLEHRFRSSQGEIDIVCKKNDTLIFVEVKQRRLYTTGIESINQNKKRRLFASANIFLSCNDFSNYIKRFDAIIVTPKKMIHIKNFLNEDYLAEF